MSDSDDNKIFGSIMLLIGAGFFFCAALTVVVCGLGCYVMHQCGGNDENDAVGNHDDGDENNRGDNNENSDDDSSENYDNSGSGTTPRPSMTK
ncbi:MAG: hypothetical protein PVI75_08340 [Gammaproteobacteria bacterium]|jgi:hypothetical protein